MKLYNKADSTDSNRLNKHPSHLPLTGISECRFDIPVTLHHKARGLLQLLCCLSLLTTTPSFADLVSPVSLVNKQGTTSSQPLGVLKSQDQASSIDDPTKYLQFTPG